MKKHYILGLEKIELKENGLSYELLQFRELLENLIMNMIIIV